MPLDRPQSDEFTQPLRRILQAVLIIFLLGVFLLWRIDGPRMERFRAHIIDAVLPSVSWAMTPVIAVSELAQDFRSYQQLYDQNQELRRELQQMKSWKEAALQLEQENARLLDLNKVRLDAKLTRVTGVVLADSGSPFRQSVLINVGARDGILDGWATMDGLGLVGRVSGVGPDSSRVILLTDSSSRIPASIEPSGQSVLIIGDNTLTPPIDFIEIPELVRPGDRIVSSGDGGVFPPGLLIGQVAKDTGGRLRVLLAADYGRLKFLRVLRSQSRPSVSGPGSLVAPLSATALDVSRGEGAQ